MVANTTKIFRALFGITLAAFLVSCVASGGGKGFTADLYAIDTNNGKVFEIDAASMQASSASLVATTQRASGEAVAAQGKVFVAVGSYGNNLPGLYWFDPANVSAGCARVGGTATGAALSVQYICIVSPSVGWLSVADYSGPVGDGLYKFNPSDLSAVPVKVLDNTILSYPQDLVLGTDGYLYIADSATTLDSSVACKLVKANATNGAKIATFSTTAGGTTGLLAGNYGTKTGIFVANNGGYDSSYIALPGSLDFLASDATDGSVSESVIEGLSVSRLAAFSTTSLAATNYGKSYVVNLGTKTAVEVQCSGVSFGSTDVKIKDGYAYVPAGLSPYVYSFDQSGAASSIPVGDSSIGISNICPVE